MRAVLNEDSSLLHEEAQFKLIKLVGRTTPSQGPVILPPTRELLRNSPELPRTPHELPITSAVACSRLIFMCVPNELLIVFQEKWQLQVERVSDLFKAVPAPTNKYASFNPQL